MENTGELTEIVGHRWAAQGFDCGLWIDPPGQVWEDYVHRVDEMVCVLEGVLELTVSGRTTRLLPGEECLIPAHAVHTVKNVGGTTARWLYGYRVA